MRCDGRHIGDGDAPLILAELSREKIPNTFRADAENWFEARQVERGAAPRKQK